MKKSYPLFAIIVLFVALIYFLKPLLTPPNLGVEETFVKIAGQKIKVELADTPLEHARGLSGRSGLKEDEGMLFVFSRPGLYPFWMKDMNFPIDIIWLDENLKVISIKKNAQQDSYPDIFSPEVKAKYVLEVTSGFTDEHDLKVGDTAEFTYP